MPELLLQRHEATLIVTLGEQSASVPLERVMPNAWCLQASMEHDSSNR